MFISPADNNEKQHHFFLLGSKSKLIFNLIKHTAQQYGSICLPTDACSIFLPNNFLPYREHVLIRLYYCAILKNIPYVQRNISIETSCLRNHSLSSLTFKATKRLQ